MLFLFASAVSIKYIMYIFFLLLHVIIYDYKALQYKGLSLPEIQKVFSVSLVDLIIYTV